MTPVKGNSQEVIELVQMLGLPPDKTMSMDIRIDACEVVILEVRMLADRKDIETVKNFIRRYKLVEVDNGTQARSL